MQAYFQLSLLSAWKVMPVSIGCCTSHDPIEFNEYSHCELQLLNQFRMANLIWIG